MLGGDTYISQSVPQASCNQISLNNLGSEAKVGGRANLAGFGSEINPASSS
jgi:hypothetical protein